MKLRNSNILIFGGSSGIGKAIAEKLISAGATVMITGRNIDKLEDAKKEINSPKLHYAAFDILLFLIYVASICSKECIALFDIRSLVLGFLILKS